MLLSFLLNQKKQELDIDPETPILWVVRDHLKITGTKFGCGMAQCGACTVHLDGQAIRSCVTPISAAQGKQITTIEGANSKEANAVQQAWNELDVVQCGYCQSGQIMSATALLKSKPKPTDQDIDSFMQGNICRCSTYVRIRSAIHLASQKLS